MSCLGRIGRFGNQFFQYAFLRHYARRHGLAVQTPPWIGQELFDCSDPPIAQPLPVIYEPSWDAETALLTRPYPIVQNADLCPYAGMWDLPGGFLHEDEHPLDALRRELLGEPGLDVEPMSGSVPS